MGEGGKPSVRQGKSNGEFSRNTGKLRLILIKDKHPVQLDATLFRGQLRETTVPKDSSASFYSFRFVFFFRLLLVFFSFRFPSFFLPLPGTPSLIFRGIRPRLFYANYPMKPRTRRRKLETNRARRESRQQNGERFSRDETAVERMQIIFRENSRAERRELVWTFVEIICEK